MKSSEIAKCNKEYEKWYPCNGSITSEVNWECNKIGRILMDILDKKIYKAYSDGFKAGITFGEKERK